MPGYLEYKFEDTPEFISTFDELPLWSASFGLLLLKRLELRPNLVVLDLGSGAGFPLLELAQRLGTYRYPQNYAQLLFFCYGALWATVRNKIKRNFTVSILY